jgi:peptidase M23-like protein
MARMSLRRQMVAVVVAGAGAALVIGAVLAPASASGAGGWAWPVRGAVITQYTNDNLRPYLGGMHRGIDIAAVIGTRVVASRSGRVTFAGPLGSSGVTVAIATADGRYVTSYLHLGRVAVERGESVGAGHEIGAVGTTGKRSAEQPHLHFGVRRAGPARVYVDPLSLLPPANPELKPVPAGSLHPRRQPAAAPAPVLTPEPSPFPGLGWGPPVCLAGLLLLAAVVSRQLVRDSGARRREDRAQPAPRTTPVGVSGVGSVSQLS